MSYKKRMKDLLSVVEEISECESPVKMYDIAIDTLKKFKEKEENRNKKKIIIKHDTNSTDTLKIIEGIFTSLNIDYDIHGEEELTITYDVKS